MERSRGRVVRRSGRPIAGPWLAGPLALALLGSMASARAAEDKPVNLLRLANATVATTSAEGEEAARLSALTDGNPGTSADLAATHDAPLEIVYRFAGAEVAPE